MPNKWISLMMHVRASLHCTCGSRRGSGVDHSLNVDILILLYICTQKSVRSYNEKKSLPPPPFPIEKILDPTCTSISLFPSKYDPNRLHVTSEQLVSVRQWSLLPLLCGWYFELVLCNWNIRIKQTIYFGSSKQITEIAVPSSPTHDQKCIIRNIAFVINLESTILQ